MNASSLGIILKNKKEKELEELRQKRKRREEIEEELEGLKQHAREYMEAYRTEKKKLKTELSSL